MLAAQRQHSRGFTIVELLIVVVVISILAAITVVAYNGITARSREASVSSDVLSAVKKLETLKIESTNGQYPSSLAGTGIAASGSNTYDYEYSSTDNSFCIQSSNGTTVWYASSVQTAAKPGTCGSDGMIGQWTFNGNSNDSGLNGLNATTSGVTLATGQNGQTNSAYSFPGSAAYITAGNSSLFNVTELTMSVWARPASAATVQTLMAKESKQKYRLNATAGMGVLASTTTGWTHTHNCAFAYAVNTWYHTALTISSASGRAKLFVNGVQICDNPGPIITGYNTNELMIGSYNLAGGEGFNGILDDARFYGRALTAAEIKGVYDSGAQ